MKTMPVFVNITWDFTIGAGIHRFWPIPSLVPPAYCPSLEMVASQKWYPGYALWHNKFTTSVKHKGTFICLEDHDIGPMILDITFPIGNAYYPIMWPFSSREMVFWASTVKYNKRPVSASDVRALAPLPMLTCCDLVPFMFAFPMHNYTNTLKVGLTPFDLVIGVTRMITKFAIETLMDLITPSSWDLNLSDKFEDPAKKILATVAEEIMDKVGLTPASIAKKTLHACADFGVTYLEGNPTFKLALGSGVIPEIGIQIDDGGSSFVDGS